MLRSPGSIAEHNLVNIAQLFPGAWTIVGVRPLNPWSL